MADSYNPYAPPAADLETQKQVGAVARDGDFVRMDRNGHLPDRCVSCNAPALAARVGRTLYWARWEWRAALYGVPLLLFLMMIAGAWVAGVMFIPALLVLAIANVIVRKRLAIEIGLCDRHSRIRRTLAGTIMATILAMIVLPFAGSLVRDDWMGPVILILMVSMVALGVVYSYSAANRIAIKRLDERHVWLKGAGTVFRNSLPEATPD